MLKTKPKGNKRYVTIATIFVLSILALGLVIQSFGSTTSTPPWYLNAPPASDWDIFISKFSNGTFYYETSDWQTWTNNANAMTILQAAVNACPSGGKIYVDSSVTFAVDTETITINKPLTLTNSLSHNTEVSATVGVTFTFFRDLPLFNIGTTGAALEGVTIEGFRFINEGGNRATNAVFSFGSVSHSYFRNNYVNMAGANATVLYFLGNGSSIFTDNNYIEDNTIRGWGTGTAVDFQAKSGAWSNTNYIDRNYFWNGGTCLRFGGQSGMTGDADYNYAYGNTYGSTAYGIYDTGTGNRFFSGTFMDVYTGYTYYGTASMVNATCIGMGGWLSASGPYNATWLNSIGNVQ